ncbi:DUF4344 domain-containing metallopeptidase [Chitinolyticbacter meiyuanensis]|uniref:DUF4344 domain-containing metallopeptidase n=1 Tax=Chitinolyticbacter meiyuanensis TaxID=682798 RepID=UPI0011E5C679|nr:DUF4344 domain-containing metallopeptidase [Chitinolyticbacter meiyuanensis]
MKMSLVVTRCSALLKPPVQEGCRRGRAIAGGALAVALLGLAACGKERPALLPQAADPPPPQIGKLRIAYTPPEQQALEPYYSYMKGSNVQATMLPILKLVNWPHDLILETKQCGAPNAYYYPGEGRIVSCYELAKDFHDRADVLMQHRSPEYRKQVVIGGMKFVFLHEMGHAVYDAFQVPIVGNPEDAADAFAIYMLLHCKDPSSEWILKGAKFFFMKNHADFASTDELQFGSFADSHPLHQQRYFNMLCYAYGSNTDRYGILVEKGFLPQGRAASCEQDWHRLDKAMRKLLAGHFNLAALDDPIEQAKYAYPASQSAASSVAELPFGLGPLQAAD